MCQRLFSATWAESKLPGLFKLPVWHSQCLATRANAAVRPGLDYQSTNMNVVVIWVQARSLLLRQAIGIDQASAALPGPVTVQVASWYSPRACQGGYGQASAALAQTQFKLPVWNSPIPGPASAARLGAGYQSTNLNLVVTWVQSLPVK